MFILTPGDSKVQSSEADGKAGNFGATRQVTAGIQNAADYTKHSLDARDIVLNPVKETIRDVDDLNDSFARKSDTKYQDDLVNAGTPGDANFIISDMEKRPLDEGREDSAFQKPDANKPHSSLYPFNPDFMDTTGVEDEGN